MTEKRSKLTGLFLSLIRIYQKTNFFHSCLFKALYLSDNCCRFVSTCSQYTYEAIYKYGIIKGLFMGLKRIVRCHPWNKGGRDPLN